MRRAAAVCGVAVCCALAAPALGHDRATARIDAPAEGATVEGDRIEVVVTASAGGSPAEFRLLLDGQPVDEAGRVGGGALFTTFRVPPGTSKRVAVALAAPGEHTLRLEPTPHADRPESPLVRRFSSRSASATPSASATAGHAGHQEEDHTAHYVIIGSMLVVGAGAAVFFARRGRQPEA